MADVFMRRMAATVAQAEHWVDGSGRHDLATMDPHHRANLIPYLRRSAIAIHQASVGTLVDQAEAEAWLADTPLMARLLELEAGRPIDDRRATHQRNQEREAEGFTKRPALTPMRGDDWYDDGEPW